MSLVLRESGSGESLLLGSSSLDALIDQCMTTSSARRACRLSKSILKHFGIDAQYNGYWPAKVIHRKDVERISDGGEIIVNGDEIVLHQLDFPKEIESGDTVEINDITYQLKAPLIIRAGLSVWLAV